MVTEEKRVGGSIVYNFYVKQDSDVKWQKINF